MSASSPSTVRSAAVIETARAASLAGFSRPTPPSFGSHPAWAALRAAGTTLWLDTGDVDAARALWTDDFENLTTNNTLVNKEVQKGLFDSVIQDAGRSLREADPSLTLDDLVYEAGFVVNCRTALRLVEAFDATVSVELHPAMADDAARSIDYGRRYFAVCPDRFIVKVPLTPAGFVTARQLAADGIPINYTLGFSARQNILAAAFSRVAYVNVFMGRLNSFVSEHGLGDGKNVGERTTMATQMALRHGREHRDWVTQLIGASMRSGEQVRDLAGLDVFTMPTAAAAEFKKSYEANPGPVPSGLGRDFPVSAEPSSVLDPLWTVDDATLALCDAAAAVNADGWTGEDFATFVRDHGGASFFRAWNTEERAEIQKTGKIPSWTRWKDELTTGQVALDDLMSASALYSFVTDQGALDARVRKLLTEAGLS